MQNPADKISSFDLATLRLLANLAKGDQHAQDEIGTSNATAAPLSPSQERLWFVEQLHPNSSAYNLPILLRFSKDYNVEDITHSIEILSLRHDALRTRTGIDRGQLWQWVEEEPLSVEIIELSYDDDINKTLTEYIAVPFNFEERLSRAQLFSHGDNDYLLLTIHHILADGWSMQILADEINKIVEATRCGKDAELSPIKTRALDVATWQHSLLKKPEYELSIAAWESQLKGAPPTTALMGDYPRPRVETRAGAAINRRWEGEIVTAIDQIASRHNTSRFCVLLAGFAGLLASLSHNADHVIGTPFARRDRSELKNVVTYLVEMLPLRVQAPDTITFGELIAFVSSTFAHAIEHADVSLQELISKQQITRNLAVSPLFQIVFAYQDLNDLSSEPPPEPPQVTEHCETKFELTLSLRSAGPKGLDVNWEYRQDLFEQSTIENWIDQYGKLLLSWCTDPNQPLTQVVAGIVAGIIDTAAAIPPLSEISCLPSQTTFNTAKSEPVSEKNTQLLAELEKLFSKDDSIFECTIDEQLIKLPCLALRLVADTWKKRFLLPDNARIASDADEESHLLAACIAVVCKGSLVELDANPDLIVCKSRPLCIDNIPTLCITWILDARHTSETVVGTWPISSRCMWAVAIKPYQGTPQWPTGIPLLPEFQPRITRDQKPVLPGGIGDLEIPCIGDIFDKHHPIPQARITLNKQIQLIAPSADTNVRGLAVWPEVLGDWIKQQPGLTEASYDYAEHNLVLKLHQSSRLDPVEIARLIGDQLGEPFRPIVKTPDISSELPHSPQADEIPSDAITAMVLRTWQEVMNRPSLRLDDDFFEIGGSSITALDLLARQEARLGTKIPLHMIFEGSTVRTMSALIRKNMTSFSTDTADEDNTPWLEQVIDSIHIEDVQQWTLTLSQSQITDALNSLLNEAHSSQDLDTERELLARLMDCTLRGGRMVPASLQQSRLWFSEQVTPDTTVNNLPLVLLFSEPIVQQAMQRSLVAVIERHEALRTQFHLYRGELWQEVVPEIQFELQRKPHYTNTVVDANTPFDLEKAPLVRAYIFDDDKNHLLLLFHHIIVDGWSMKIIREELYAAYQQALNGDIDLGDPPPQAPDFALSQRKRLNNGNYDEAITQWVAHLREVEAVSVGPNWPLDNTRLEVSSLQANACSVWIDSSGIKQLQSLAAAESVSLFQVLALAVGLLSCRLTGNKMVTLGSPIADRASSKTQKVVAYLVDVLPLIIDLKDNPTISEALARIRSLTQALDPVPFVCLSKALQQTGLRNRHAVINTSISLQELTLLGETAESTVDDGATTACHSPFDMDITFVESPDGRYRLIVAGASDLMTVDTVQQLAHALRQVIKHIPNHSGSVSKLISPPLPSLATPKLSTGITFFDKLRQHADSNKHFSSSLSYRHLFSRTKQLITKLNSKKTIKVKHDDYLPLVAAAQMEEVYLQLKENTLYANYQEGVPAKTWIEAAQALCETLAWSTETEHPTIKGRPVFVLSAQIALAYAGGLQGSESTTELIASNTSGLTLKDGPSWKNESSGLFLEACGGFAGLINCADRGTILWEPRAALTITICQDPILSTLKLNTLQLIDNDKVTTLDLYGWVSENFVRLYGLSSAVVMTANGPLDKQILESYLKELPGITTVQLENQDNKLKAIIEAEDNCQLSKAAIIDKLKLQLGGSYSEITIQLGTEVSETNVINHPESALEIVISKHWRMILNKDCDNIDQNFFEAGGSSINAIQLLSSIREQLDLEIDLGNFFASPTIRSMANNHFGSKSSEISQDQNISTALPQLRATPTLKQAPLSFSQERMWFLSQLYPESTVDNMVMVMHFDNTVSQEQVEDGLTQLTERHAVLKTNIVTVGGTPLQTVRKTKPVSLSCRDARHKDMQCALDQSINQLSSTPINLKQGTWRGEWIVGDKSNILVMVIHHIICDGWSIGILQRELKSLCSSSDIKELPPLQYSYADYCRWQRTWLSGALGLSKDALQETVKRLEGSPESLSVPPDKPKHETPTWEGALQQIAFDKDLYNAITELASHLGVTAFSVFVAGFSICLARWSGEHDIILGSPSHQRNTVAGIENIVGLFVNTLVLRIPVEKDSPFSDIVQNAATDLKSALKYEDLPFEQLVSAMNVSRNIGTNPLFQVMIAWQDFGDNDDNTDLLSCDDPITTVKPAPAHFDLTLFIRPAHFGYHVSLEYSTELYNHTTAARLLLQFRHLLHAATHHPQTPAWALPLAQADSALPEPQFLPRSPSLSMRIAEIARQNPNAIALEHGEVTLSYQELITEAAGLAGALHEQGVQAGDRVAISLDTGLDASIAFLACLWLGASYVPIDITFPKERQDYIFQDACPKALISKDPNDNPGNCYIHLHPDQRSTALAVQDMPLDHELYVVYTSGSTGYPKGVSMPQSVILCLLDWHLNQHKKGLRTGQFAPLGFDVSIQEYLVTWTCGDTLVITETNTRKNSEQFISHLFNAKIERLFLPYVALQQICTLARDCELPALREVITAGEQLRISPAIRNFFSRHPNARLFNQYGPSETHVVTEYALPANTHEWLHLPPIGKAVAGATIIIVDEYGAPAPIGINGEIWIGGAALANGYLGREKETTAKFVRREDGTRWYRTGDYGRYRDDGNIHFTGRKDQQTKIRGFRVELGEIEAALSRIAGIDETVVTTRSLGDTKQLIAYVCPESAPKASLIQKQLSASLPHFMIPAHIVHLQNMPKTSSGKLNRQQLPPPQNTNAFSENKPTQMTPLEKIIADLWSKLLDTPVNTHNDDFFALGGQSLLVTKFVIDLEAHVGFRVPLALVFRHSRLSDFCKYFATSIYENLGDLGNLYIEKVSQELQPILNET